MDRFWDEHNTQTTELLRDMARFFAPFEPLDGNLYIELIKILGGTRKKAVMVTTNYDLLIEHAIVRSGLRVTYGGFPVADRNMPILKIHGSCNFLPDLGPLQVSGIGFDMGASSGAAIETGVRPAQSAQEVIEFCDREDSVAPALAMYSPSKQVLYCRSFIQAQQQAWLAALNQTSRIYVVGLRVHTIDEHIWRPLASAKAPLYYVGREPEDFITWSRDNGRRETYVLARSFEAAIPHVAMHHRYRPKPKPTDV